MSVKTVRKLTVKNIIGGPTNVRAMFDDNVSDGDSVHLFGIAGIANRVRYGESAFGPFSELQGEFIAVLNDGTQLKAGKCFVPDASCHGAITNTFENTGEAVEFSFNVSVVADSESATGYFYQATEATAPKQSERLSELVGQISG